jgi:RimJ/RimL family protein N-acetyltransferase
MVRGTHDGIVAVEPNAGDQRWAHWAMSTMEVKAGWWLRPLAEADIPAVQASVDDHVRRGLGMDRAFGLEEATNLVTQTAPQLASTGRGALWGIARDEVAGSTSVHGVISMRAEEGNRARVGYWLAAPARGGGIASASLRALTRTTTAHGGLTTLAWTSQVGNTESLRVARAAGFQPVGTGSAIAGADSVPHRAWWAELRAGADDNAEPGDRHWAECLVEIAAGAWQLQPMDAANAADAERVLPVSACVPTGVWAAKEITTARVDAIVALLHQGDRGWVIAQPVSTTSVAAEAAHTAAEVAGRYARQALGLTTP